MWLHHFRHKHRTQKWRAFRLRYYEYRAEDCIDLCRYHHKEIHKLYWIVAGEAARRLGPCRGWTWKQAEALMERLRKECEEYISC